MKKKSTVDQLITIWAMGAEESIELGRRLSLEPMELYFCWKEQVDELWECWVRK